MKEENEPAPDYVGVEVENEVGELLFSTSWAQSWRKPMRFERRALDELDQMCFAAVLYRYRSTGTC